MNHCATWGSMLELHHRCGKGCRNVEGPLQRKPARDLILQATQSPMLLSNLPKAQSLCRFKVHQDSRKKILPPSQIGNHSSPNWGQGHCHDQPVTILGSWHRSTAFLIITCSSPLCCRYSTDVLSAPGGINLSTFPWCRRMWSTAMTTFPMVQPPTDCPHSGALGSL